MAAAVDACTTPKTLKKKLSSDWSGTLKELFTGSKKKWKLYIIYMDLMFPTFWNQHVAVKKKQRYLLSGTTIVLPPRVHDGHLSRLRHEFYTGRKKCCNDDDESDQSYRGTPVWIVCGNNCQTAHPTRAPRLLPTAGNGTAQQSVTTLMTMSRQYSGRMAGIGSWDTSESVFQTRVLPGG